MADVFTAKERSRIMARVRGKDTAPELAIRSMVHRLGYRFRLHQRKLPGNPDIVLPCHKKIILVHGCFWHGHKRCKHAARPKSNRRYWNKKIDRNIERDRRNRRKLRAMGWDVLTLWECDIKNIEGAAQEIRRFLARTA